MDVYICFQTKLTFYYHCQSHCDRSIPLFTPTKYPITEPGAKFSMTTGWLTGKDPNPPSEVKSALTGAFMPRTVTWKVDVTCQKHILKSILTLT